MRELIKKHFGQNFSTNTVDIKFHAFQGKDICLIEVKRGDEPVYLELPDKNGNKSKKFYVRSGNSSIEMSIEEALKHINIRF